MSTSLRQRGDGRTSTRTREFYVNALREYLETYGELTAACFAPASAKRNGRPDLVERYYSPRSDGTAWPSLNAIKKLFGGFDAARAAVGLPPNPTGPLRGRRKPGSAPAILEVRERRVVVDGGATAALRRQLEKAERRALRAEQRLDEAKVIEVSVEDVRKIEALRERLADERARRKDVQRELSNAERREARARARADSAKAIARAGDPAALAEVDRLTNLLANTQVRIRELESAKPLMQRVPPPAKVEPRVVTRTKTVTKKVEVKDERLLRRVERAEAKIEDLRSELLRSEAARAELADRLVVMRRDAMVEAVTSERVRAADRRADAAEKKTAELAEMLVGQRRPLTSAEIKALRRNGPAGEMMVAAALRGVRRARLEGGRLATADALHELAVAALGWENILR